MAEVGVPTRVLRRRPVDPELERLALARGLPLAAARVLAGRGVGIDAALSVQARLPDPFLLPDMRIAAARLARALDRKEPIAVLADHDMDGTASAAVLEAALVDVFGHPPDRVQVVMSHRLKEGYGMTPGVADRIAALSPRPGLVITADCGSSDAERIAWLGALEPRIETIVTDHHGTGEGIETAVAFVNPQRACNRFPDRAIAGCGVAWITLLALARYLSGPLMFERERALAKLLDYVAVGTVADCVDLASPLNRYIVRYGLSLVDRGLRPCWQVALDAWFQHPRGRGFTGARDVAFSLAPRIAATGRLDEASPGVRFLRAATVETATEQATLLDRDNTERKRIQAELEAEAMVLAAHQVGADARLLLVDLPAGHIGVQGIVASRLVERYARPAGVFSPRLDAAGVRTGWSGSLRGGGYMDVREWIVKLQAALPETVLGGGGHPAAGGLSLAAACDFDTLRERGQAIAESAWCEDAPPLGRLISLSDGELAPSGVDAALVTALARIEPWGRGYEAPAFDCVTTITGIRPLGDGTHLKLSVSDRGGSREVVWFRARSGEDVAAGRLPVAVSRQFRNVPF